MADDEPESKTSRPHEQPGNNITLDEIREWAKAAGPVAAADTARAVNRAVKSPTEQLTRSVRSSFSAEPILMPHVAHLQQLQANLQAQHEEILASADSLADSRAEELERQKAQADAIFEIAGVLRQQAADTRELVHSGWSGGVVMQWTLYVAAVALVSTVIFGVWQPAALSLAFWIAEGVLLAVSAAWLLRRQVQTRPQTAPTKGGAAAVPGQQSV